MDGGIGLRNQILSPSAVAFKVSLGKAMVASLVLAHDQSNCGGVLMQAVVVNLR